MKKSAMVAGVVLSVLSVAALAQDAGNDTSGVANETKAAEADHPAEPPMRKIKPISEMSKEEIRQEIQELERKKQESKLERERAKSDDNLRRRDCLPKSVDEMVTIYEGRLEQCADKKNDRCADVMYTLGMLYYGQSEEHYHKALKQFNEAQKAYEKNTRGTPPKPPVLDCSKSMNMYRQLAHEYPQFPKQPVIHEDCP